ncbi:MAG: BamA/OMP85 family outer membrane protein [Planctomycetota bacterium]
MPDLSTDDMLNMRYKIRNTILFVLLSAALSSLQVIGASSSGSDKKDVIKSIEFENNRKYKDKTLRKKLDFEVGDYLDPILAESGRRIIAEFYRKKGFPYIEVALNRKKLSEGKIVYAVFEGLRIKIKSVNFKGNQAIKTSNLKKAIKTKTRSWLLWPAYYTEEKIAADVEKLRTLYYERGFLNHRVTVQGRTHITFIIEEGPLYKVRNITLKGNKKFDNETLLADNALETGETYYQRKAQAHTKRILKLYREIGYVDADVRQHLRFIQDVNVVDVEYKITEGRQFRIGKVEITGNEQVHDKVIRRILDEQDFSPGQLYNADIAPKQGNGQLERYVQLGTVSEEVMIRPAPPKKEMPERRDAVVNIKEGLTGMWNPGVAIGSDSGVVGQVIWHQRNFDIKDWPESFEEFITMRAFKGAGQSLRIALQPGTEVSYYSATFTEPYFRDKPISLDVVGSSFERWRESHNEKRKKAYVGFEKRLKNRWRPSLGFRVEDVEVVDLDYDAPQEIIDVKGHNLLLGAKLGIGRDMRNDRYTPSGGYLSKVEYEQVTGDYDFGILEGKTTIYRTLYEDLLERRTVLAVKVLAASTVSEAPPFERFYAGGTGRYGIRGFEYRGVSTRGLQTNVPDPVRKDPIGSDWIFLANSEITMPLVGENIGALFFIDSGTIDTGSYRASIGAGIEIIIPQLLGSRVPMRFEFATPFMKDDEDETQVFSFYMGRLY